MQLNLLAALLFSSSAVASPAPAPVPAPAGNPTIPNQFLLNIVIPSDDDLHLTGVGLEKSNTFFQLSPYGLPTAFKLQNGRLTAQNGARKASVLTVGTSPGGTLKKIVFVPSDATGPESSWPTFSSEKKGGLSGYETTSDLGVPCVRSADPGNAKAKEVYFKPKGSSGTPFVDECVEVSLRATVVSLGF